MDIKGLANLGSRGADDLADYAGGWATVLQQNHAFRTVPTFASRGVSSHWAK